MWPVSARFLAAVRDSRTIAVQGDIYRAGVLVKANIPIASGSLRYDSRSDVRRAASLVVSDPALRPWIADDALAPYGNDIKLSSGIVFGDGLIDWCPIGMLMLDTASVQITSAGISVEASDWVARVKAANFEAPLNSLTSVSIVSEITRLIQLAYPSATVIDTTGSKALTSSTPSVYDGSPWTPITELAASIGAEVVCDPIGRFIIRPIPTLAGVPVWAIDAGIRGVLMDANRTMSRTNTYNRVIVKGDQAGAAGPIVGIATDTDPNSPTRYGGPIGKLPTVVTLPNITTQAQANAAAAARLANYVGAAFAVDFTSFPNPALDGGDLIELGYPPDYSTSVRRVEKHLIDTFVLDLGTAAMTGTTRSNKPDEGAQ